SRRPRGARMSADYREFSSRLTRHFAALGEMIEVQILSEMIAAGDTFCSIYFELDEQTVRTLVEVFTSDSELWGDFQQAIEAHRQSAHWTALLEHVFEVGKLQGKLVVLERATVYPPEEDRVELAEYFNSIDGEIAFCREFADRRNFAA